MVIAFLGVQLFSPGVYFMLAVADTTRRLCVFICCTVFLRPPAARAVELNPGDIIVSGRLNTGRADDVIYHVNPVTGDRTLITSMNYDPLHEDPHGISIRRPAVAVDSQGTLFAAGFDFDSLGGALLKIDPATGNRTVVSDNSHGSGPTLAARVLQAAPNGSLFAYSEDLVAKSFLRIDRASGNRSYLPDATFNSDPLLGMSGGLAVAPDGNLWIISKYPDERLGIIWVNPETGEHGIGSSSGSPSGLPAVGTGPALTEWMSGISFAPNGDLYLQQQFNLLRIDPLTGNRELVSSWDPNDSLGSGPAILPIWAGTLAVEPDGSLVAISEDGALIRVDPVTGDRSVIADFGPLGFSNYSFSIAVVPNPVPEPSAFALAGLGAMALLAYRIRGRGGIRK